MNVIIDTSIFIHANYHITLKYVDESQIDSEQLALKTISQIKKLAFDDFMGHDIVLALDPLKNFRVEKIYPDYKGHRKPKNFDKVVVNEIMQEHFYCLHAEGLESDDLMYLFSEKYPDCFIVSQDRDCRLMLSGSKKLYNYKTKESIMLNESQVELEKVLKVSGGDSGDNVPNIKLSRFGEKKILQICDEVIDAKDSLAMLEVSGLIGDWEQNYELVVYDNNTYLKYFDQDYLNQINKEL